MNSILKEKGRNYIRFRKMKVLLFKIMRFVGRDKSIKKKEKEKEKV